MNLIFTILIDGLTYASWLFIVALGLTLVFGVLKILNVAHGSFYALGAYAAATLVGWFASMQLAPELSLIAMLLAAVAVAALIAPLCERGLLRVFYGRDEVLLVLDGSTGQNAYEQAKQFSLATDINALAITKLDGTAKGGVVIGISDQFNIPVKYIGMGERPEQLQIFNRFEFVDSLFTEENQA
jgi:hypothetical protein